MIKTAITSSNLVLGPANLYIAPYGSATEPTDASVTPNGWLTPPSSPWTDVGGTEGGVSFEVDTKYTDLTVDQIIMNVGSRLTELSMMVTTKLSEVTLGNLTNALNSITSASSGTGYSTLDITVTSAASQPSYAALMIYGWAPFTSGGTPALRRIIVRKVLSQAKVALMYDKKTQASYGVTFNSYFVSNSINPVHIADATA